MVGMNALMFFANKVREERDERARLGLPPKPTPTRAESLAAWERMLSEPDPLFDWLTRSHHP